MRERDSIDIELHEAVKSYNSFVEEEELLAFFMK